MGIQIIPEAPKRPTTGQMFGQAFSNVGAGLGQNISQALVGQQEKQKLNQLGFDINGINDPNLKSLILQDQMTRGRKLRQSEIAAGVENQMNPTQGQALQQGGAAAGQAGSGAAGGGNLPQPETAGTKEQVLSPTQVVQQGRKRAMLTRNAGGQMTDEEGIAQERTRNDERRQYNQDVEADVKQRVGSQRDYGNQAEAQLLKYFPDAPPDIIAAERKFAEEAAGRSQSEADINREIAEHTTQMKNVVANVKNAANAPTIEENLQRSMLGNDRKRQDSINDMRLKLDPLLKNGHYDTARALLAAKNWSPESIESIISDLGEGSRKAIATMPEMKKYEKPPVKVSFGLNPKVNKEKMAKNRMAADELAEENRKVFTNSLQQAFKTDPSANLVLLRKAYMEKGVDYRMFKNALNDMIFNGTLELNDDQFKQLDPLDEPPYNQLEKLMKAGNIID